MKTTIITGITGQDGSYLSELLLKKGYDVHGIVRRGSTINTRRIDHLLFPEEKITLHYGDLSDTNSIYKILMKTKPDEIYNIGSMSHVRVSFDIPEYTGAITGLGVCRILEAVKNLKESSLLRDVKYYQASSSEMYGLSPPLQNENTPFLPVSPYGCAKLYGYHMTRAYRKGYGMFACNGILFNHECVTENTPIIVNKDGYIDIIPIEEIVPHRKNLHHSIKVTTEVKNGKVRYNNGWHNIKIWDGNNWTKIKTMTATGNIKSIRREKPKKIVSVTSRGGYYETTPEHISFLKGKKEIETQKLKEGDMLELQDFPNLTEKIVMTKEEAEFLGMIVADGYIGERSIKFTKNDDGLRKRVNELWSKIIGGSNREVLHKSGFSDRNVKEVILRGNTDYMKMLRKEMYTEKKYKRIPFRILNSSKEIIETFLKSYNRCDGLKAGKQKTEFKSFTTNSSVLALGLWYLVNKCLKLRITLHPEFRSDKLYYHININSDNNKKGQHLKKPLNEIKKIKISEYEGWLFDLETESGTFSAGVGLTWIHNSPRRGETFVTKKIVRAACRIKLGTQDKLVLGNCEAMRDWGFAGDYMEAIYKIMHHNEPDDFVVATEDYYSVQEFLELVFKKLNLSLEEHVETSDMYKRPNEVPELRGDATKIHDVLGWKPKVGFNQLVDMMIESAMEEEKNEKITTA